MSKEVKPRQYLVDAEQLKDMMKYLMTRPYGEVYSIMNTMATLKPFNPDEVKRHKSRFKVVLFCLTFFNCSVIFGIPD